jgi:hypothetical protein
MTTHASLLTIFDRYETARFDLKGGSKTANACGPAALCNVLKKLGKS